MTNEELAFARIILALEKEYPNPNVPCYFKGFPVRDFDKDNLLRIIMWLTDQYVPLTPRGSRADPQPYRSAEVPGVAPTSDGPPPLLFRPENASGGGAHPTHACG